MVTLGLRTDLGSALKVFNTISVNVVMGSDGFSELRTDDQTRSICWWSTRKQHDSSSSIWEGRLRLVSRQPMCMTRSVGLPREGP